MKIKAVQKFGVPHAPNLLGGLNILPGQTHSKLLYTGMAKFKDMPQR